MTDQTSLSRAFDLQAAYCVAAGAPFSASLLTKAGQDIAEGGPLATLMTPWAEAPTRTVLADAVPLRWLGCLHDLALSGDAPDLSAAYPRDPRPGDGAAAWVAARSAMIARHDRFAAFMSHEPQTNEVRRSACLTPGFLTVAERTSLPLRIFEIGASAGLNQLWDRYAYDFGEAGVWGPPTSEVRLTADWQGPPPPLGAPVSVIARAACDRKPVDIRDPIARRRLKAYIWAEQFDRLARLEGAIAMSLAADTRVEAEDAVSWAASRAAPKPGAASVLFHSVFWQYMRADSQVALTAVINDHGALATADAPFAWLRMEPPPDSLVDMELRLSLWPGGEDRILARVHPHGATINWAAAAPED